MADAILARQITEQVTRLRQRQTAPLILELDLTDGIGEGPVGDPLSAILSRRKARMQDIIDGLRRAGRDDRVRALVVKVGGGRIGLARMQELREAVGAEFPAAIFVSARTGEGVDALRDRLGAIAASRWTKVDVTVPHREGGLLQRVRERGKLRSADYGESGIHIQADVPPLRARRDDISTVTRVLSWPSDSNVTIPFGPFPDVARQPIF